MFESMSFIERRARTLIQSYYDWLHGSARPILDPTTPTTAMDMTNLHGRVDGYGQLAKDLLAADGWEDLAIEQPDLARKLKADLTAMAEESDKGAGEIIDMVDPEKIWSSLHHSKKRELTHQHVHPPHEVDALRARLHHELRKQTKLPPAPAEPLAAPPAEEPPPPITTPQKDHGAPVPPQTPPK